MPLRSIQLPLDYDALDVHPLDRLALQRVARVRRELIGRTTPPDGLPGLDTPGRPKTDD
jgi:hypothetical protein